MNGLDVLAQVRANVSSLLLFHELQNSSTNGVDDTLVRRKCYWKLSSVAKLLAVVDESAREIEKHPLHSNFENAKDSALSFDLSKQGVGTIEDLLEEGRSRDTQLRAPSQHAPLQRLLSNAHGARNDLNDEVLASPNSRVLTAGGVDKLSYRGFHAVKQFLQDARRVESSYSVCLGNYGKSMRHNVGYISEDNPFRGWVRDVMIRMTGKERGYADVHYINPECTKRLRSRNDLLQYFDRHGLPLEAMSLFDFRRPYCVCFSSEDSRSHYLACNYGLAGCGGWVHPHCVGLGFRSQEELERLPPVICPLCAAYLEGTGEIEKYVGDSVM